jgi:HAD superfamily hydrolase (TIGR01509 family)
MTPPKAALFDIDGTLVDSNDAHASAWARTLAEFGYHVPFSRIRALIGKGGDKLVAETVGFDKDTTANKAIGERRRTLFENEYLPALEPLPGARDLVLALHERHIRLVVATSATREESDALLDVAGVREFMSDIKTSSDAADSKPDPDIVLAALKAAHCDASEAVMIGDTPYDVEAAGKAGLSCIAFRSGGWDDEALRGAVAIYDDAAHLLRELGNSPVAR